jgi:hypothetical protein
MYAFEQLCENFLLTAGFYPSDALKMGVFVKMTIKGTENAWQQ